MLETKIKRFLKYELNDWDSFKYTLEKYDETQIKVEIKNIDWQIEKIMYFELNNDNLSLYMASEYWQNIEDKNYNKFFWIELLAVNYDKKYEN